MLPTPKGKQPDSARQVRPVRHVKYIKPPKKLDPLVVKQCRDYMEKCHAAMMRVRKRRSEKEAEKNAEKDSKRPGEAEMKPEEKTEVKTQEEDEKQTQKDAITAGEKIGASADHDAPVKDFVEQAAPGGTSMYPDDIHVWLEVTPVGVAYKANVRKAAREKRYNVANWHLSLPTLEQTTAAMLFNTRLQHYPPLVRTIIGTPYEYLLYPIHPRDRTRPLATVIEEWRSRALWPPVDYNPPRPLIPEPVILYEHTHTPLLNGDSETLDMPNIQVIFGVLRTVIQYVRQRQEERYADRAARGEREQAPVQQPAAQQPTVQQPNMQQLTVEQLTMERKRASVRCCNCGGRAKKC